MLFKLVDYCLFRLCEFLTGNHQNSAVDFFQSLVCLLHALFAEFAHIVDAGGVDQNHRADAENLY